MFDLLSKGAGHGDSATGPQRRPGHADDGYRWACRSRGSTLRAGEAQLDAASGVSTTLCSTTGRRAGTRVTNQRGQRHTLASSTAARRRASDASSTADFFISLKRRKWAGPRVPQHRNVAPRRARRDIAPTRSSPVITSCSSAERCNGPALSRRTVSSASTGAPRRQGAFGFGAGPGRGRATTPAEPRHTAFRTAGPGDHGNH